MNLRMPLIKRKDDFFRLFVIREWREVIGRKNSNLWLIVSMLTVTFLAIAFSNASLRYLSDKMNDPFVKWVDIKNSYGEGDFTGLESALSDQGNMERFDYDSYQADYYFSYMFFGPEGNRLQFFQCRFFQDIKTELVSEILDEKNVIKKCAVTDLSALPDETIGLIITESALTKLGYENIPAYIDLCHYCVGADSLGFKLYDDEFARVPIPLLGVVKRLPSNVDIIASKFFYEQDCNDNSYPFNLAVNHSYSESLRYFVPEMADCQSFVSSLSELLAESSLSDAEIDEYSFYKPEIVPFVRGSFVSVVGHYNRPLPHSALTDINEKMLSSWKDKGVCRVFDYEFSPYEISEKSYLSVYFNKLTKIKDFEDFVSEFKVKVDMSQINSKDNYNAVNIMANILSWFIIVLAIVCIVLFLVDLLKSYFLKVRRNIGTFKAFGVSNSKLTGIYVLIVEATILISISISLLFSFFIQVLFKWCGVLKDGVYPYLALGSMKTVMASVIIIAASFVTVRCVIGKLLSKTPGDLIYDRQ